MSEPRCEKHDMVAGTCSECDAEPRRPLDELVLCHEPGNRDNHRVHEPGCYYAEPQYGVDVEWPRETITRRAAVGLTPCGACQPSLPKAERVGGEGITVDLRNLPTPDEDEIMDSKELDELADRIN